MEALKSGKVAGAGIDVFETEPATENPLFNMPNVVCTPHLGASTTEAQENVALQIAEQMADYLIKGAVSNAINVPSITAEEAPRLKPFIKLAEVLGAFVGQVTDEPIEEVEILFDGSTAAMNTRALISAALAGLIRPQVNDVNMVSAPIMVKERGIIVSEVKRDKSGVFDGYIKLTVKTTERTRSIAGTVFSDGKPRFIRSRASISMPRWASTCSTPPTMTRRASSASSARSAASTGSTSPTSSLGATGRAATRSRFSTWMHPSRRTCWRNSGRRAPSSRRGRFGSTSEARARCVPMESERAL